ncbi:ABC transporter ATP-binding protein [Pseudoalteromonas sp. SSM20]|uniref:ABC transporter ATP-binding protein n=1 Tax=Pseudoalteromonas sp. SSM20 TaxID=3139394 RepID=UPI003BAB533B
MSKEREIAIQVSGVSYEYTQRKWFKNVKYQALNNINLSVYKGETLGIEGRNGSGKSTLLKLLAGIYKPTSGSINCFGNHVSLQTLSAGFDVELSGADNALIGAMLLGHPKQSAISKQEEIMALSELGEKFYEPVKTYSAGMRARLGFATAITMKTDVLLIDEVLGVGDALFREKAEKIIKEKTSSEMTVIVVSHVSHQLNRLCDRIVKVQNGDISI